MNNNGYLSFAKEVAFEAGRIMLKYFKEDNGATYKLDRTIVTLADKEINEYLIECVKEKFPTHSVNGEEASFGESNYVWVCDPVDGTAMYARHITTAVFSLALVIDGESEVGVVYDPFTNTMYSAIKGKGAYKNDARIFVNNLELNDERSVSNFDIWQGAAYDISKLMADLLTKTYFVSLGSVIRACMAVASGDFTIAIFPGGKGKNCDIAAVKVIVEEAGGKVTDLFGDEQRYDKDSIKGALISNSKIHSKMVGIIKKYV